MTIIADHRQRGTQAAAFMGGGGAGLTGWLGPVVRCYRPAPVPSPSLPIPFFFSFFLPSPGATAVGRLHDAVSGSQTLSPSRNASLSSPGWRGGPCWPDLIWGFADRPSQASKLPELPHSGSVAPLPQRRSRIPPSLPLEASYLLISRVGSSPARTRIQWGTTHVHTRDGYLVDPELRQ